MLRIASNKNLGSVLVAVVCAVIAPLLASLASAQVYPLKVGPNGRYLVDQTGTPVFLNADAGWSMVAQLTYSGADQYLTDRANRGFNGVLVNLIEHMFADHAPANIYNVSPWTGPPFTTPNEPYFALADSMISRAQALGICVFLFPTYLGADPTQGWSNEISAASYATMKGWGAYLGNRYKNYPNIIWVMGGDRDPSTLRDKIDSVVAGIKSTDNVYPGRLYTTHSGRGNTGTINWPESWVTLSNIYVSQPTIVARADMAYAETPILPFFLIEGDYEYSPGGATPQEVRTEAYWTVLRGGCGHTFGNAPIWFFSSVTIGPPGPWQAQLGSAGSVSMTYFKNLFTSRNWFKLLPDRTGAVITSGAGSDTLLATFAYASDSTTIIGYLPTQRSVTINPGVLRGDSIHVQWYNPATGAYLDAGTFTKVSRSYSPPAASDWALVIDAPHTSTSCCTGTRGNVNGVGIIDVSDLSALVSYLTGSGYVLPCSDAANVDGLGIVDLADLTKLVNYLTGGKFVLPNCP